MLIDLHMTYGDAAVLLGVEPRFSIADAFENMHRMDAAVLRALSPTAVRRPAAGLVRSARGGAPDVAQMRSLIELAATQYTHLVLDVPRASPAILDALEAAGTIVLVTNQELATVRSAARLSSALQQRYGRERVQLVVNRFDERAEIAQRDVERVTGLAAKHLLPNQLRGGWRFAEHGTPAGSGEPLHAGRVAQEIHTSAGQPPGTGKPRARRGCSAGSAAP